MDYLIPSFLNIPGFSTWEKIVPINKGWSFDKKYYIETQCGQKLILRTSDFTHYSEKKDEFNILKKLEDFHLNISKPIHFGSDQKQNIVYSIYSWVEGIDAETELQHYTKSQQYKFGVKAGSLLRKIHSIAAPANPENWYLRYNRKIDQRILQYRECDPQLDHDESVISFLTQNRELLRKRPQTFQHGDFHVGNLIIGNDNSIGAIDFNRMSYGDPWEEYDRSIFSSRISKPFINGQIHGYFEKQVPDLFLKLMAVYTALNCLSSIPWAMDYGEEEVNKMREIVNNQIRAYNGYSSYIPNWFQYPNEIDY